MPRKSTPIVERIKPKLYVDDNGCWVFTGALTGHGYGHVRVGRRGEGMKSTHRAMYEHHVGPIPEGLELDHLCRNRACCNPAHLEPVTTGENIRRGNTGKKERDKTHCPAGHAYAGANLFVTKAGHRVCRACRNRRSRELYAARHKHS